MYLLDISVGVYDKFVKEVERDVCTHAVSPRTVSAAIDSDVCGYISKPQIIRLQYIGEQTRQGLFNYARTVHFSRRFNQVLVNHSSGITFE